MIILIKVLLIIVGLFYILYGVNKEDFTDLFYGMFMLIVGIGLEQV